MEIIVGVVTSQKWSGQNRIGRTACYAYAIVRPHREVQITKHGQLLATWYVPEAFTIMIAHRLTEAPRKTNIQKSISIFCSTVHLCQIATLNILQPEAVTFFRPARKNYFLPR